MPDEPASQPPGPFNKDRQIRVFISSTFRDMQEERDILIKKIFPQLRKLCEERAVTWTEVDLRWGITTEQAAEGKVLPLCLEEIQRCRPHFVGLLGERYGWVPEPNSIPAELLESQPWLKQHLDHSVTELEILHGVFSEESMHGHAYFYFRDPKYLDSVAADKRQGFTAENAEAARKLAKLKQKIRGAHEEQICELREGYANPEQLGEWILEDFTKLIDHLYPKQQAPGALDQEAARHEAYARSRRLAFVGREDLLRKLNGHVSGDAPITSPSPPTESGGLGGEGRGEVGNNIKPLVLTGESGCGKSALLAEWVARWRKDHPDDLIIQHYIGSTPDSADWQGLVRRILSELKRAFAITDDIPLQPDSLRGALNDWTVKAAGSRRIILVLDALNQLAEDGPARQLGWLPVVFPTNFRVIVSSLPGESLDALKRRGWPELNVPLFARADIAPAALAYFKMFSKTPPKDIVAKLESTPAACNALYLRAVLDELRQFGKHEELKARAADYLSAPDLTKLFDLILGRWEQDFGADLVRQTLSLIWASRYGLSEAELSDLLGTNHQPLPRAKWTPLYLAAENSLAQRSGLLTFSHSFIREAVSARFLPTNVSQQAEHRCLAEYFIRQEHLTGRKLVELPWHLKEAQLWPLLVEFLTDVLAFAQLQANYPHDLLRYWSAVSDNANIVEEYNRCLAQFEKQGTFGSNLAKLRHVVATFLLEAGRYEDAVAMFKAAQAEAQSMEDADWFHERTAHALAAALLLADKLEEAGHIYEAAIARCGRVDSRLQEYLPELLNGFAVLKRRQGEFAQAETLYRRAISLGGEDGGQLRTLKMNLGGLLMEMGKHDDARQFLQEAVALAKASSGNATPEASRCLVMLGRLDMAEGQLQSAKQVFEQAYSNMVIFCGQNHPETLTVGEALSSCLMQIGDYDAAKPILTSAYRISRERFGSDNEMTLTAANNLAALHHFKNELSEAETLLREVVDARRKRYPSGHQDLAVSIQNLARLLSTLNRFSEAQECYRESLAMLERFYGPNHPKTLLALHGLAELQESAGPDALDEEICRRELADIESRQGAGHPDVGAVLNKLALILKKKGDYPTAEQLYLRALSIAEASFGIDHESTAAVLFNTATLRVRQNNFEGGKTFFERAFPIWEKRLGQTHANTNACLNALLLCMQKTGKIEDVERIGEEQIKKRIRDLGARNANTVKLIVHVVELLEESRGAEAARNFVARIALAARGGV